MTATRGRGVGARTVTRNACVATPPTARADSRRLDAALGVVQETGAVEAYRAFNNDQRIPHSGAAFFTKVLYFAGGDSTKGPYQPIILDRVVSRALKDHGAVAPDWPDNGWTTDQYRQYLAGVHAYAHSRGVLPDQIEAALFSKGKQLP
ncbi:hypothetical protein ACIRYZ_25035 [Kitasatospora sp. NPDC101155]|uniref:8-oxoguanine DNA glycosylase OGG fold protein n=1 Tax=Kitasatospora sp. NPDC101155 TaxID=3364097 RepID=UPI0037F698E8